MSGLSGDNVAGVATKLIELGLNPNAGVALGDGDVRMQEAPEYKRLREVAVTVLGEERGGQLSALVGELGKRQL